MAVVLWLDLFVSAWVLLRRLNLGRTRLFPLSPRPLHLGLLNHLFSMVLQPIPELVLLVLLVILVLFELPGWRSLKCLLWFECLLVLVLHDAIINQKIKLLTFGGWPAAAVAGLYCWLSEGLKEVWT